MPSLVTWRILPLPILLRLSLFLLWGPFCPSSLVLCLSHPSIVIYTTLFFAQTSVMFLDGLGFLLGLSSVCIRQCNVHGLSGIYNTCFCLLLLLECKLVLAIVERVHPSSASILVQLASLGGEASEFRPSIWEVSLFVQCMPSAPCLLLPVRVMTGSFFPFPFSCHSFSGHCILYIHILLGLVE